MPEIARITLLALLGAALSAADANAVLSAFDISEGIGGRTQKFVMVFMRDRLVTVGAEAPELIVEGSDGCTATHDGEFLPYTAGPGKGAFHCEMDGGGAISGTITGDKVAGSVDVRGMKCEFTGTRAKKRYQVKTYVPPSALLDQAREKLHQRKPKDAIDLFLKVIEADRYDLQYAAPALVDLVQCFQLLKDDPVIAKRWRSVSERLLSAPPELDGAAVLDLEAAQEDLLWRSWPDLEGMPAKPLLTFTLESAEEKRQMREGKVTTSLEIRLAAKVAGAMRFVDGSHRGDDQTCTAVAVDEDGAEHPQKYAYAYTTSPGVSLQLTFEGTPRDAKRLKKLSGTVKLTQEKESEAKEIALREGETWETPEASCKIGSIKMQGGGITVQVDQVLKSADGGHGSSSTSSSGSAGNRASPLWLVDEKGARCFPYRNSATSTGRSGAITLAFAGCDKPKALVHHFVTKTSTREIPFTLTDVELQ